MYSKFPFRMENIPRQRSFLCLSLKFGCIFSALIIILYTVLALAQSSAMISGLAATLSPNDVQSMVGFGMLIAVIITHCVTIFLTAIALVGILRDKHRLMRPWLIWTSVQVTTYVLIYVFCTVMYVVGEMKYGSLAVIFIECLILLVRFYTLILVASYYEQLEEENQCGERLKTFDNETWYQSA